MKNKLSLISTKFVIPEPRRNYIKRDLIISEINNILDYKVILIKGIAGSGKTTLLSSFFKQSKVKNVKWLSLDEENDELYSFWYYFFELIKEFITNDSEEFINIPNELLKKDSIFNLIIYIINELSQKEDVIIVLDDFYYIKDEFLNSTIEYLIKHSSSNIHYILLTREEPQIYLGEFRAQGNILEIGDEILKFSLEETSYFIENTLELKLLPNEVNKIFRISEGWVVGTQLVVLALKNKMYASISDIKASNKYIIEYLNEEIIKQLDIEERNFLIKISILDYFNAELCNYVLNINNSEEIIQSLNNKNLFIIVLDNKGGIFRLHNIFKKFLNTNFVKLDKRIQITTHLKAYDFYIENENYEDAINHLLKINYYEEAIKAIKRYLQNSKGWYYLKQIPLKFVMNEEELIIQIVYYYFSSLQIDKCREVFNLIANKEWPIIKVFKMLINEPNIKFTESDIRYIDEYKCNNVTKSILYFNVCYASCSQNDFKKALYYSKKCYEIARQYNIISLSIFSKSMESIVLEGMGEFYESLRILEEMKGIIIKTKVFSNLLFMYHLSIVGILLKMNKIDKAESEMNLVKSSINTCGNENIIFLNVLYNLVEIKFLQGENEEGIKLVNELVEKDSSCIGFRLYYLITCGLYTKIDLENFADLYEKNKKEGNIYSINDKIVYSRVLYLLGNKKKAKMILNEVLEYCRRDAIKTYLVDGLVLMILIVANDEENNKRDVLNLLREAIHYSIDNNYYKPYVLEGQKILIIIKSVIDDPVIDLTVREKKFIKILFDNENHHNNKVDILSKREREVLEVLAEGFSNKQIGERLNISVATVKTHVNNIYTKLELSNRMQAIEGAKKLLKL